MSFVQAKTISLPILALLPHLQVQAKVPHFKVAYRTAPSWLLIRTAGSSGYNKQPASRKVGHCRRVRFFQEA